MAVWEQVGAVEVELEEGVLVPGASCLGAVGAGIEKKA